MSLLLLFGGSSVALGFKPAIAAALKADPTLSAIIAGRVNPVKLGQGQTYPALRFAVVSRSYSHDLDGFAGTVDASVEFTAESTLYSDVEAIIHAVRSIFDGFQGLLSGVRVNFALARDDSDDYAPSEDAGDDGTFTDSITILFSYVLI